MKSESSCTIYCILFPVQLQLCIVPNLHPHFLHRPPCRRCQCVPKVSVFVTPLGGQLGIVPGLHPVTPRRGRVSRPAPHLDFHTPQSLPCVMAQVGVSWPSANSPSGRRDCHPIRRLRRHHNCQLSTAENFPHPLVQSANIDYNVPTMIMRTFAKGNFYESRHQYDHRQSL